MVAGSEIADILILYRDALFAHGIASLLRAARSVRVVGVSAEEEETTSLVRALRPAVVILEGPPEETRFLLPPLLDATAWVIRVGVDGKAAEIYRHTRLADSYPLVGLITRLARRGVRA